MVGASFFFPNWDGGEGGQRLSQNVSLSLSKKTFTQRPKKKREKKKKKRERQTEEREIGKKTKTPFEKFSEARLTRLTSSK